MRRHPPAAPPLPLIVSARPEVVEAVVARLPRHVDVEVATTPTEARRSYAAAARVLVGTDLLTALADTASTRRSAVALLLPAEATGSGDRPDASACVRLGVEQVLDVEQAAAWLGASAPDRSSAGQVIAVVGARGGCGTSTLAAAVALTAASRGTDTLLVDLDGGGGGLDVLLGAEQLPGPRWPDLDRTVPGDLFRRLPERDGLRLLSAGRCVAAVPADLAGEVLQQAAASFALTVVDLPRTADPELLPTTSRLLLVVPDEVRASAAAAAWLGCLGPGRDVRLVVRDGPGGEPAPETAARLGHPLAGRLRSEARLPEQAERGLTRPARPRSPLWRLADQLLAGLSLPPRPTAGRA